MSGLENMRSSMGELLGELPEDPPGGVGGGAPMEGSFIRSREIGVGRFGVRLCGIFQSLVSCQNTTIVHGLGSKRGSWKSDFVMGEMRMPDSGCPVFHMSTQALSSVSTSLTDMETPSVPRRTIE